MPMASEFNDDDDFDWEAAVAEIDKACSRAEFGGEWAGGSGFHSSTQPHHGSERFQVKAFQQRTLDTFLVESTKKKAGNKGLAQSDGRSSERPGAPTSEDCGIQVDIVAAKTWIYPANVPHRDYQYDITRTALFSNTLVSLPTGLGKTLIAAVVMYNYFRWFPTGKIIFTAPSRPLVVQQIEACHKSVGIPQDMTIDMTGQMVPAIRAENWQNRRVFFVTPQVLERDIQSGTCVTKQIVCLVVDEAHRATGNYSYCVVVRELLAAKVQLRILALTATPGSKQINVQAVVDNLQISCMEYRDENDPDVRRYTHSRSVELIEVAMNPESRNIKDVFLEVLQPIVYKLCQLGVFYSKDIGRLTPFEFLTARDKFREAPPQALLQSRYSEVESNFGVVITLYHVFKLLLSHGIRPAYEMLQQKMQQGVLRRMGGNDKLRQILGMMKESLSHGAPSPKLEKVVEIVLNHFRAHDARETRVIIFTNFRESVKDIMETLATLDAIKAMEFIGQSSGKSSRGQTQKTQQAVLQKFRDGGYNTIVATSIAEEGLDIMEVDLVICFDANVSPLRMIQRMGRTGRKRNGRVVVLASEGAELQGYLRKQAKSRALGKHMCNGGVHSFEFHSSPRMIPHRYRPQVQLVELAIEEFIPRCRKNKSNGLPADNSERVQTCGAPLEDPEPLMATPEDESTVKNVTPEEKMPFLKDAVIPPPDSPDNHVHIDNSPNFQNVETGSMDKADNCTVNLQNVPEVEPEVICVHKSLAFSPSSSSSSHCPSYSVGVVLITRSGDLLIAPPPSLTLTKGLGASEPVNSIKTSTTGIAIGDSLLEASNQGAEEFAAKTPVVEVRQPPAILKNLSPLLNDISQRLSEYAVKGVVPASPILCLSERSPGTIPCEKKICFNSSPDLGFQVSKSLELPIPEHDSPRTPAALPTHTQGQFHRVEKCVASTSGCLVEGASQPEFVHCTNRARPVPVALNREKLETSLSNFKTSGWCGATELLSPILERLSRIGSVTPQKQYASSDSEEWQLQVGEVSTSAHRPRKLRRLRKACDTDETRLSSKVLEGPSDGHEKRLQRVKLVELKSRLGKHERKFAVQPFVDDEAEVSSGNNSSDEDSSEVEEDEDHEGFIDRSGTQQLNGSVDMMAVYRQSLLTPPSLDNMVGRHKHLLSSESTPFSNGSSHSSEGQPIFSRESEPSCANEASGDKREISYPPVENGTPEGILKGGFKLKRSRNLKQDFRKRKLSFQPHASSVLEPLQKVSDLGDDFFDGIDLDALEAEAAQLSRSRISIENNTVGELVGETNSFLSNGCPGPVSYSKARMTILPATTTEDREFHCFPSFHLGIDD